MFCREILGFICFYTNFKHSLKTKNSIDLSQKLIIFIVCIMIYSCLVMLLR